MTCVCVGRCVYVRVCACVCVCLLKCSVFRIVQKKTICMTFGRWRQKRSRNRIIMREDAESCSDYGVLFYYKNRLIKAYEKVGCQKKVRGSIRHSIRHSLSRPIATRPKRKQRSFF